MTQQPDRTEQQMRAAKSDHEQPTHLFDALVAELSAAIDHFAKAAFGPHADGYVWYTTKDTCSVYVDINYGQVDDGLLQFPFYTTSMTGNEDHMHDAMEFRVSSCDGRRFSAEVGPVWSDHSPSQLAKLCEVAQRTVQWLDKRATHQ
jgi:hypothetical protein